MAAKTITQLDRANARYNIIVHIEVENMHYTCRSQAFQYYNNNNVRAVK